MWKKVDGYIGVGSYYYYIMYMHENHSEVIS